MTILAKPVLVALSESQNHRCAYCGVRTILRGYEKKKSGHRRISWHISWRSHANWERYRRATLDHVTPKSAGGGNSRDNLIMACLWCNQFRRNAPAMEASKVLGRMVRRGTHPHIIIARKGYFPTSGYGGMKMARAA